MFQRFPTSCTESLSVLSTAPYAAADTEDTLRLNLSGCPFRRYTGAHSASECDRISIPSSFRCVTVCVWAAEQDGKKSSRLLLLLVKETS